MKMKKKIIVLICIILIILFTLIIFIKTIKKPIPTLEEASIIASKLETIESKKTYCENRQYPLKRCLSIQNKDKGICYEIKEPNIVKEMDELSMRNIDGKEECLNTVSSILAIYNNDLQECDTIDDKSLKLFCKAVILLDKTFCDDMGGMIEYYSNLTIPESEFCRDVIENLENDKIDKSNIWAYNYVNFVKALQTKNAILCENLIPLITEDPSETQGHVKSSDKMKADCLALLKYPDDKNFCYSYYTNVCDDNYYYSLSLINNTNFCNNILDKEKKELCITNLKEGGKK